MTSRKSKSLMAEMKTKLKDKKIKLNKLPENNRNNDKGMETGGTTRKHKHYTRSSNI